MLGFMCNGRHHVDGEDDDMQVMSSSSNRKSSLQKKKVTKLVIGGPTDFKHHGHMGYDEISGRQMWDIERELTIRAPESSTATSLLPSLDQGFTSPPSPPRSLISTAPPSTSSQSRNRRKQATYESQGPNHAGVSGSFNSPISPDNSVSTNHHHRPTAPRRPSGGQDLRPTPNQTLPLSAGNTVRSTSDSQYVSQATKPQRWDGSMVEVDRSLTVDNGNNSNNYRRGSYSSSRRI